MFVAAVCFLFLLKLKWPKSNNLNKKKHHLNILNISNQMSVQEAEVNGIKFCYSYKQRKRRKMRLVCKLDTSQDNLVLTTALIK